MIDYKKPESDIDEGTRLVFTILGIAFLIGGVVGFILGWIIM